MIIKRTWSKKEKVKWTLKNDEKKIHGILFFIKQCTQKISSKKEPQKRKKLTTKCQTNGNKGGVSLKVMEMKEWV